MWNWPGSESTVEKKPGSNLSGKLYSAPNLKINPNPVSRKNLIIILIFCFQTVNIISKVKFDIRISNCLIRIRIKPNSKYKSGSDHHTRIQDPDPRPCLVEWPGIALINEPLPQGEFQITVSLIMIILFITQVIWSLQCTRCYRDGRDKLTPLRLGIFFPINLYTGK